MGNVTSYEVTWKDGTATFRFANQTGTNTRQLGELKDLRPVETQAVIQILESAASVEFNGDSITARGMPGDRG